jgi:hypothetical protein
MGISDFGQVSRRALQRSQKGTGGAERRKAQIETCREFLLRMDFKRKAPSEFTRAASQGEVL